MVGLSQSLLTGAVLYRGSRNADSAGADRAFFLSCESRFFDLNLRKKGDENGNEPSSPSAAM